MRRISVDKERKATARWSCRIDPRIKQRAEEAAALLGQSITDFTESALEEKAQAVFERFERIVVSERDFAAFVAAIQAPPKPPTPELLAAAAEYKRRRAQEPEGNW